MEVNRNKVGLCWRAQNLMHKEYMRLDHVGIKAGARVHKEDSPKVRVMRALWNDDNGCTTRCPFCVWADGGDANLCFVFISDTQIRTFPRE